MRQKKHKKVQRTLTFLKIHYRFREPYKVVLDGNFINALLQTNSEAAEALGKLLSAQVKVFTSRCVLNELHRLGPELADAVAASRNYMVLHCGHEDAPCSPAECLADQIGDTNPEHLFIATQDRALRAQLAKVPGSAMVFASVNGLHLEAPSAAQKADAQASEAASMAVAPHELKTDALSEPLAEAKAKKGKGIFRRHKAKGPNPLAMKKKKARTGAQAAAGSGKQQQRKKRTRKRGSSAAGGSDA